MNEWKTTHCSHKLVIIWGISDPGSKRLLPECTPGLLVSGCSLLVVLVRHQLLRPKAHTPPSTHTLTGQLTTVASKTPQWLARHIYYRTLRKGRILLCCPRLTLSSFVGKSLQNNTGLKQVKINRILVCFFFFLPFFRSWWNQIKRNNYLLLGLKFSTWL